MRKTILLLAGVFILAPLVHTQSVDSISLEQSGDLIKVHYKILNSNPNQVFRVSVLCSIDGGLKSQLNSLSGDFGENIIGGRDSYLILWDVLKDVDELNSAEFFIKAELVKDLSEPVADNSPRSKVKGKFYFLLGFETPGPKGGFRVGFMGSFGVTAGLNYGNIPVLKQYEDNVYYNGFDPKFGIGLDVTKRIINLDNFQLHLMAGYRNTDLIVYWKSGTPPQFWRQGMDGLEAGMVMSIKHAAIFITVTNFNPKQLEIKLDEPVELASPDILIDVGLGIKF
jgi:hypothetical protein